MPFGVRSTRDANGCFMFPGLVRVSNAFRRSVHEGLAFAITRTAPDLKVSNAFRRSVHEGLPPFMALDTQAVKGAPGLGTENEAFWEAVVLGNHGAIFPQIADPVSSTLQVWGVPFLALSEPRPCTGQPSATQFPPP